MVCFGILLGLIGSDVNSGMVRFIRLPIRISHRFVRQRAIEQRTEGDHVLQPRH
jgi:hypothetical protein